MVRSSRQIPIPQAAAACTAFAAFAVSIFVGMSADNPASTVIGRALIAMAGGFALGFAVGLVCDWLVREEIGRVEDAVFAQSSRSGSAVRDADEVDLQGLTGVDVIEEDDAALASASVASDDARAVLQR